MIKIYWEKLFDENNKYIWDDDYDDEYKYKNISYLFDYKTNFKDESNTICLYVVFKNYFIDKSDKYYKFLLDFLKHKNIHFTIEEIKESKKR